MRNLNEEPGFRYDDSSSKKGLILNSKNELFFDKKLKLPNWKKKIAFHLHTIEKTFLGLRDNE